ncbi:MAG TPA: peptidylprolyl isomerase [Candidatus Cloacimonadota bacterium]|nr:peptidylprolyl isomerase [Candidatus Cloacimonadota bacterium]HQL14744.1 peptidylprolyl isomerase [Candidatus Cloacimonadota bacterium]
MRKTILITLLLCSFFLCRAEVVDKIVARVGNEIILLSDLTKQINQMKSANMYPEGTTELDVLEQMIESRLIIQKAKELNYTDKLDQNAIKTTAEKQIRQIKSRFSSEEEYQRQLRQLNLTNSDLMKYFQDLLTEQELTRQFYRNQIALKVKVSDKEVRDFYEDNKDSVAVKPVTWEIGMIMRQAEVSPETNKAQYKAIKDIQERLRSGESFAKLARTESQCPSAERDGDLGYISKGMMVKPFEDAAFSLAVGEVSDIVKSEYGYHIIKVTEKRGDEIRVSHILRVLQPSAADTLAARQLMESIRQQYLNGTPFDTLAVRWSMDKESAKDGGSIGEYGEDDFPEIFAPVLKALPVGGISDVLENEGTFYLFAKLKEYPSRMLSFDEISKQIREYLTMQKQRKIYQDWIEQLKRENFVEILI